MPCTSFACVQDDPRSTTASRLTGVTTMAIRTDLPEEDDAQVTTLDDCVRYIDAAQGAGSRGA